MPARSTARLSFVLVKQSPGHRVAVSHGDPPPQCHPFRPPLSTYIVDVALVSRWTASAPAARCSSSSTERPVPNRPAETFNLPCLPAHTPQAANDPEQRFDGERIVVVKEEEDFDCALPPPLVRTCLSLPGSQRKVAASCVWYALPPALYSSVASSRSRHLAWVRRELGTETGSSPTSTTRTSSRGVSVATSKEDRRSSLTSLHSTAGSEGCASVDCSYGERAASRRRPQPAASGRPTRRRPCHNPRTPLRPSPRRASSTSPPAVSTNAFAFTTTALFSIERSRLRRRSALQEEQGKLIAIIGDEVSGGSSSGSSGLDGRATHDGGGSG